MGFFPCSKHGLMFRGPAEAAYPALVIGQTSDRAHLRLCHECFTDYVAAAEGTLFEVSDVISPTDDHWVCLVCRDSNANRRVFITAYPRGEAPRQFFGGFCAAHEPQVREAYLVPA